MLIELKRSSEVCLLNHFSQHILQYLKLFVNVWLVNNRCSHPGSFSVQIFLWDTAMFFATCKSHNPYLGLDLSSRSQPNIITLILFAVLFITYKWFISCLSKGIGIVLFASTTLLTALPFWCGFKGCVPAVCWSLRTSKHLETSENSWNPWWFCSVNWSLSQCWWLHASFASALAPEQHLPL